MGLAFIISIVCFSVAVDRAESQPVPTQNPAPAHGLASEDINRLAELGQLHRDGVLTDEEFAQEKARILE